VEVHGIYVLSVVFDCPKEAVVWGNYAEGRGGFKNYFWLGSGGR